MEKEMIVTLVLMVLLGNGNLQITQTKEVESIEHCVNDALIINQDMTLPFSAFCFYEVKK
jgi:hypothetical protein